MIYPTTRRSILVGAAGFLISAPAIVRAKSLMPVRTLPLQFLNPLGEFYRRCYYHSLGRNLPHPRPWGIKGIRNSWAEVHSAISF